MSGFCQQNVKKKSVAFVVCIAANLKLLKIGLPTFGSKAASAPLPSDSNIYFNPSNESIRRAKAILPPSPRFLTESEYQYSSSRYLTGYGDDANALQGNDGYGGSGSSGTILSPLELIPAIGSSVADVAEIRLLFSEQIQVHATFDANKIRIYPTSDFTKRLVVGVADLHDTPTCQQDGTCNLFQNAADANAGIAVTQYGIKIPMNNLLKVESTNEVYDKNGLCADTYYVEIPQMLKNIEGSKTNQVIGNWMFSVTQGPASGCDAMAAPPPSPSPPQGST